MESHLVGAVELGDVSKVIQLLREGVDVNCAAGLNGETALMAAAVCGNVDILTILLSCPALAVNQRDLSGQTALHVASVAGHAEFVSALLQHPDTDPNIRDLVHGATPLVAALVQGHGHVVSVLVADEDVDLNTADTRGHTPLIIASGQGLGSLVSTLLAVPRLRLDTEEEESQSQAHRALQLARDRGHVRVADMIQAEMWRREGSLSSCTKLDYGSSAIEQRFRNSLCIKEV